MIDHLCTLNDAFITCLKEWGIENTGEFFAVPMYASIEDIPRQGFKVHLSATVLNCESVVKKVIPYFLQHKIQFKVIKDVYTLVELNKGWLGYSQIGKFITVYPKDTEELKDLVDVLREKTNREYGPTIPTDKKIGDILYYRYGAFYYKDGKKPLLTLPNGQMVEDKKIDPVPSWIEDDPFQQTQDFPTNANLPDQYFIIEQCKKGGKGGVYRILDFQNLPPTTRFMKEATPFGDMETSGIDAVDRMKWETTITKELSRFSSAYPEILKEFSCGEHHFFITEDRGKSLKDILVGKEVLERSTILEIIFQLCHAVHTAHNRNIILRDLSLDNVLWDGQKVSVIDLEYAYRSDGPPLHPIGTPGFSLKRQMDQRFPPLSPLPQHDMYSIGSIWHTLLSPESYVQYIQSNPTTKDMDRAWKRSTLPDDIPLEIKGMIQECMENSCSVTQIISRLTTMKEDLEK